ncbi:MAG: CDP-glycerol glycerophosphotransferase family protein [Oscillospiraceae bacterium]|nr:CDP-glycerol glycerophosphotransferase family protein [Oscillospiraceae bacterium]
MAASGLRKKAYDLVKKHPGVRLVVRKCIRGVKSFAYESRTRSITPDDRTVLFCSYNGRSASCSPRAIYDYMVSSPAYKYYRFIWAVQDPSAFPELADASRTELVDMKSRAFEWAMARAGYWVFNSTLPEYICPKLEHTVLQCWHGTPLKRLGFDIQEEGNAMNSLREIRRKYRLEGEKVDYFLSPSPFATECFRSAWRLGKWGRKNAILEAGYPRNDRLVNATENERQALRAKLGIPQGKKAILYTPTFRDDQHVSGEGYAYKPAVDFEALQKELGDGYIILFRAHYLVASQFDFSAYPGFVLDVSGVEEINDLYIASDMMMTDYSSTMFDYAVLRKPILFYMYDLEQYRDKLRGFYFDLKELPGEIITDQQDLIPAIRAAEKFQWDEKWEAFRGRFAPLEDGKAAERVTHAVIGKGTDNSGTENIY